MLRFGTARRMGVICRAVIFGCGIAFAAGAQTQSKGDASRGATRAAVCGGCHGSPLAGMPVLAGQQQEFLELQMFLLREGLRDVPQMAGMLGGLADRDLGDMAAYFAGQQAPPNSASRDPQLRARGAGLAQVMGCGSCHLKDFSGQRQVPRLTNQREDYLAAALKAYRDNQRTGIDTSMNAAMYQVTDADIRALARYLAHHER